MANNRELVMMRNILIMALAFIMCSCHDNKISECVITPPTTKVVEKCSVLEGYLMDVIDETDFWETCDSTKFSMYEENSPEWMLQVIIDYLLYHLNITDDNIIKEIKGCKDDN